MLNLTPDHPIMQRKAKVAAAQERAACEAREARAHRATQHMADAKQGDDVSPMDAFNANHTVADLLDRYGYTQAGSSSDWRSPFQSSGSHATHDYGDYWVSLSDSDDANEVGAKTANGHRHGDAFDLFVHFEHGGDFKKAIAAYGAEIRPARSRHTTATAQAKVDTSLDDVEQTQESRSFDELLEAAKALEPGQIDEMEAIIKEAAPIGPVRRDTVFAAIKNATKMTLTAIREQLSQETESDDPDHLDLAHLTLNGIGRENIICADAFFWKWLDAGVWAQQNDQAIKQLELQAGKWTLQPHCREHYRTTQIPVAYEPQADAPLFCAFLAQVFSDDHDMLDKIKCVLELMGYTIMSHARHELFVMLIGPGANGKSVLLAVLEGLAGVDNVAGVQPANFSRTFQRGHLHQKLANIVTELKQGEVIADAELKAITSGEPSTVEHKFGAPFVMRPFATCWFGTNHMPHTRDFSEALFRRAVILQFNRTFAKHEQDPQLKDKLLAELPGILNLSLTAYARALNSGFTAPSSSHAAKQEWRLEADQVAQFVDDVCTRDAEARSTATNVFEAYRNWALDNGIKQTMSQKGLRERLTRLGFGFHKDRTARYVTGLRVPSWP